jgi:5-methylcytosine-specific restriction protein A
MKSYDEEKMSNTIKTLREKNGHTLKFLAAELDINYTALFKMETGQQKMDLDVLVKISKVYNVPLNELLGLNENGNDEVPIVISSSLSVSGDLKLREDLEYILHNYSEAKREDFSSHPLARFVRHSFVERLNRETQLNKEKYLVTGSVGQGQWATVPWVSCFDRTITTSATSGKFVVFLFKADMSGVYLSLNQGWTYFKDKYGVKVGREKVKSIAQIVRGKLNTVPQHLREEHIDLAANNDLARGYENGHIYGRYYDLKNMPSVGEIIADFQTLLVSYQELVNMFNGRSDKQFNDYLLLTEDEEFLDDIPSEEDQYQELANIEAENSNRMIFEEDRSIPRPRKEVVIDGVGRKRWPRNAKEAGAALRKADYKCAIDNTHYSFISKATGQPYMEAHHLVPISLQADYLNDLDRLENIKSLCPSCHRAIHHAKDIEKERLVEILFRTSRDSIESIGIEITLSSLKEVYTEK